MKIHWEEIYNNSHLKACAYFEATYRARVIGGWLIRHETCCDYSYGCNDNCADHPAHKHVDEEGWQSVSNIIAFLPDPQHKWDEFDNPMLGVCHE